MPISPHPIDRFDAPNAITAGQPLKALIDARLVTLIGESFARAWPRFERRRFVAQATAGLTDLELGPRARHIATALQAALPADFDRALPILLDALGEPIPDPDAGIGLRPFFYLPHSHYVALAGPGAIEAGLVACRELTRRFTAEFCLRPLIVAAPRRVLRELAVWVDDDDPHLRRLVSEGTRPRLPWAPRLRVFDRDPEPILALLERLRADPVRYVHRSVANHLGDIGKDRPELLRARCTAWVEAAGHLPAAEAGTLRWVVRHALRHPAKRGDDWAVTLRRAAGAR